MEQPLLLSVEDDETSRSILRLLCKRFNCDLLLAETCGEAIEIIRKTPNISMILMDVRLPDDNGLNCTKAVREIESERGTRSVVVAVTANAMVGDREACLEAGMDDYVSKPFSIDQFKNLIEKWIEYDVHGKVVRLKSG